jgi:hypothetical protein
MPNPPIYTDPVSGADDNRRAEGFFRAAVNKAKAPKQQSPYRPVFPKVETPPPQQGEPERGFVGDLIHDFWENLVMGMTRTVVGTAVWGGRMIISPLTDDNAVDLLSSAQDTLSQIPGAFAEHYTKVFEDPLEYARRNPISFALDVSIVNGFVAKGLSSASRAAALAGNAGKAARLAQSAKILEGLPFNLITKPAKYGGRIAMDALWSKVEKSPPLRWLGKDIQITDPITGAVVDEKWVPFTTHLKEKLKVGMGLALRDPATKNMIRYIAHVGHESKDLKEFLTDFTGGKFTPVWEGYGGGQVRRKMFGLRAPKDLTEYMLTFSKAEAKEMAEVLIMQTKKVQDIKSPYVRSQLPVLQRIAEKREVQGLKSGFLNQVSVGRGKTITGLQYNKTIQDWFKTKYGLNDDQLIDFLRHSDDLGEFRWQTPPTVPGAKPTRNSLPIQNMMSELDRYMAAEGYARTYMPVRYMPQSKLWRFIDSIDENKQALFGRPAPGFRKRKGGGIEPEDVNWDLRSLLPQALIDFKQEQILSRTFTDFALTPVAEGGLGGQLFKEGSKINNLTDVIFPAGPIGLLQDAQFQTVQLMRAAMEEAIRAGNRSLTSTLSQGIQTASYQALSHPQISQLYWQFRQGAGGLLRQDELLVLPKAATYEFMRTLIPDWGPIWRGFNSINAIMKPLWLGLSPMYAASNYIGGAAMYFLGGGKPQDIFIGRQLLTKGALPGHINGMYASHLGLLGYSNWVEKWLPPVAKYLKLSNVADVLYRNGLGSTYGRSLVKRINTMGLNFSQTLKDLFSKDKYVDANEYMRFLDERWAAGRKAEVQASHLKQERELWQDSLDRALGRQGSLVMRKLNVESKLNSQVNSLLSTNISLTHARDAVKVSDKVWRQVQMSPFLNKNGWVLRPGEAKRLEEIRADKWVVEKGRRASKRMEALSKDIESAKAAGPNEYVRDPIIAESAGKLEDWRLGEIETRKDLLREYEAALEQPDIPANIRKAVRARISRLEQRIHNAEVTYNKLIRQHNKLVETSPKILAKDFLNSPVVQRQINVLDSIIQTGDAAKAALKQNQSLDMHMMKRIKKGNATPTAKMAVIDEFRGEWEIRTKQLQATKDQLDGLKKDYEKTLKYYNFLQAGGKKITIKDAVGREIEATPPDVVKLATQAIQKYDQEILAAEQASTTAKSIPGPDYPKISKMFKEEYERAAEFIFDYSQHSHFERKYAQMIFPFWAFTSRMTKFMFRLAFSPEMPVGVRARAKMLAGMSTWAMDAKENMEDLPYDMRDYFPIGVGNGSFIFMSVKGLSPFASNYIGKPGSWEQAVASRFHPLIELTLEATSGRSVYRGKLIDSPYTFPGFNGRVYEYDNISGKIREQPLLSINNLPTAVEGFLRNLAPIDVSLSALEGSMSWVNGQPPRGLPVDPDGKPVMPTYMWGLFKAMGVHTYGQGQLDRIKWAKQQQLKAYERAIQRKIAVLRKVEPWNTDEIDFWSNALTDFMSGEIEGD